MGKLIIEGGRKLSGEISVQGAKNSILPIAAAALLCDKGECILHNCPRISDTFSASKIINSIGGKVRLDKNILYVKTSEFNSHISDDLSREMRSSFTFAGAMLGAVGECELSKPGGDEIGSRPIDWHLDAFRQMGATVIEGGARIYLKVKNGLRGTVMTLPFPSVGVTENIMLAAVKAIGTTVIKNAAKEPEIVDLADFLVACGAKISGAGGSTITIEGVKSLSGTDYTVMPDRIVTATYLAAAAITGSELLLKKCRPTDLDAVLSVLESIGCIIKLYNDKIHIFTPEKLNAMPIIRTMPYPGFPTDCQAIIMAVLTKCHGVSHFYETLFNDRFKHAPAMTRMGANINVLNEVAIVTGVRELYSAKVSATDLRGGASLVLMGLAAKGETTVENIYHIDRGYDDIEGILTSVGADIKRI